MEIYRY